VDTAILLCGVLSCRQHFPHSEISELALEIFNRVDWNWLSEDTPILPHGWTPEGGFLQYRWGDYSEMMMMYLLGLGSSMHALPPEAWNAWKRTTFEYDGIQYIGSFAPLFIHQYSQAWIDLRDRGSREKRGPLDAIVPRVNYFANSVAATRAQQEFFSKNLSHAFPGYSTNIWGVTASDSSKGYTDWGGSLTDSRIDGTVTPAAAAGSLMFAPDICVPALRTMLVNYGKTIYGRYGFADAFNPTTGWVSRYVIGIDVGIALLSAENLRTGSVWQWFMSNPESEHALMMVGLIKPHDLQQDIPVRSADSIEYKRIAVHP
jgi:hypothetical protein